MTRLIHPLQQRPLHFTRLTPTGITLALATALFGAQLLATNTASAQEACGDTTCPQGYTCETGQGACPAICIVPESGEGCEPCTAPDIQYCAPAACESDTECGADMRCAEFTNGDCGGTTLADPTCDPDAPDCAERLMAPERPSCEPTTTRLCTPKWQLPCATASDCGAGFTCEQGESCSTPGCTRDADGVDCPAATVTCEPSGDFYCRAVETACASDADCESGWRCGDNPNGVCSSSSDGETYCETDGPAKLCMPPYTDLPGNARDGVAAFGGPIVEDGAAELGDADSLTSSDDNATVSESGSGCSLGGAPGTGSAGFLSLVGLSALWASRRRRTNTH